MKNPYFLYSMALKEMSRISDKAQEHRALKTWLAGLWSKTPPIQKWLASSRFSQRLKVGRD